MNSNEVASFKDPKVVSNKNIEYLEKLSNYIPESKGTLVDKFENFSKYSPRTSLARFLVKYEIFKQILDIQGSIIECGTNFGGGLMTWAQLSAIMEPSNHQRRIYGFDTFEGFPSVSDVDITDDNQDLCCEGALNSDSYDDLRQCIELYDMTRYLNHIPKVELIKGDITETLSTFVDNNPHLVISLLYLDVDLFEPTKAAINHLMNKMPKGSIIVFDELNIPYWPGETQAVIDTMYLEDIKIKRFSQLGTAISYAVIGE